MRHVRVYISTKNYYITRKMDIKNPRLVSCLPHTCTFARSHMHSPAAPSCRCTCPRLPRVTRRETSEKRAAELGSHVCTSRLGSGLHLYPHALPRTPGEPRGPMRQYVPIILPHTPFHSFVIAILLRHPSLRTRGMYHIPPSLSPNRTRVMNLSVRVRVHKRATADSG